jgi:hypothetical protein
VTIRNFCIAVRGWAPQASLSRGIRIMTGGSASNANGGGRIHVAATDLSEGALLDLAENSGEVLPLPVCATG